VFRDAGMTDAVTADEQAGYRQHRGVVVAITNLSFWLSAEHAITAGHVDDTDSCSHKTIFHTDVMDTAAAAASKMDSLIRLLAGSHILYRVSSFDIRRPSFNGFLVKFIRCP